MVVEKAKEIFGPDLQAIILAGSNLSDLRISGWSDVDIVLVIRELNLNAQRKSSNLQKALEEFYKTSVGVDLLSIKEATNPDYPLLLLHSKMIQVLYEVNLYPNKILFSKKSLDFYKPTKAEVKALSVKDISFFYTEIRKIANRSYLEFDLDVMQNITRKAVRFSFNTTKLACQFITLVPYQTKLEIVKAAKLNIPGFDFSALESLERAVADWGLVKKDIKLLNEIFTVATTYIYDFAFYFVNNFIEGNKSGKTLNE